MAHVHAVSPTGDPAEPTTVHVSTGMGRASQRLDRLAPLIHQLLAWDLITPSDTGEFVLRDDVQQRLRTMTERPNPPTAQVYLGRKCESCGATGVTRMVGGARICERCATSPTAGASSAGGGGSEGVGHQGIRTRWHRKAS
jgi:ribosomal protein L37AE/L43A